MVQNYRLDETGGMEVNDNSYLLNRVIFTLILGEIINQNMLWMSQQN